MTEFTKWDVNIDRLVSLLSDRMYSDQALAGIRELVANSIDAKWADRPVKISMELGSTDTDAGTIKYFDNGRGIQDFANTYGVIGSGAKDDDSSSIGMFGIGRLSLISKVSEPGVVVSMTAHDSQCYRVNRTGWKPVWTSSTLVKNLEEGTGFYLSFKVNLPINASRLSEDIRRIFSIPMALGQCNITINSKKLSSLITDEYKSVPRVDPHNTGKNTHTYTIYYKEQEDGRIHYCHNGVEIRSEDFTGLDVWVDETHLDIKTDREGYVNNYAYQTFLRSVKSAVRYLRPKRTLQKLEVDFINGVMKRFRSFMKKADSVPLVIIPKTLPIFSSIGDNVSEIQSDHIPNSTTQTSELHPDIMVEEPPVGETPTGGVDLPVSVVTEGIDPTVLLSQTTGAIEEAPDTIKPEKHSNSEELGPNRKPKSRRPKPIRVQGTRAVDLKTEYPMIFFEQEPFTFIFNTTHPVLKEMIEDEELDRRAVGVIFERMLECFYLKDEESLAKAKERWTGVDNSLQDFL